MKKLIFISIAFTGFFILLKHSVNAQGIGINPLGNNPDPSAMLDVSSTTKGQLMPRMTTLQRDAISYPAQSLMIFNTTTNCLEIFGNGLWQQIYCLCNPPAAAGTISGTVNVCQGQNGVAYSVNAIANATGYVWTLPSGAAIATGINSNSITVNYSASASSGNITVYGTSTACGNGVVSANYPITVDGNLTASVSIVASPSGTICSGTSVTFTATPVNGGTPIYQWHIGGAPVSGATNATYTSTSLSNNDAITCVMSSNAGPCLIGSPATSNTIVATVNTAPASTFSPNQGSQNSAITFTPTVSGAIYSWTFVSGSITSSTVQNPTVTWSTAGTFDVSLTVTSNGCASTSTTAVTIVGPITQTFSYTGSSQTFTVPSNVTLLTVKVWGAEGGRGDDGTGGLGGYAEGSLAVIPGTVIQINVGGKGAAATGGWNGGGSAVNTWSGGGGGASDIRVSTDLSLIGRKLVAGGGGGTGRYDGRQGGNGGGTNGYSTANSSTQSNGSGGGGTQNSGGAAGQIADNPTTAGNAGSFGQGANGVYQGFNYPYTTGGGGGGWYGGGSGAASGNWGGAHGGGGSGYIGGVSSGSMQDGIRTGDGQITITYFP